MEIIWFHHHDMPKIRKKIRRAVADVARYSKGCTQKLAAWGLSLGEKRGKTWCPKMQVMWMFVPSGKHTKNYGKSPCY